MLLKLIPKREGAAALLTRVGLLPGVSQLVRSEVAGGSEGLPTLLTHIGLHAGVSPSVYSKVSGIKKGFPTLFALIGLLASVTTDSSSKASRTGKRPCVRVRQKRILSCARSLMP